jgi:hypothetical protein
MAVSDNDGSAEPLAQTRANRRHIGRLRTAERRDAELEHAADRRSKRDAETDYDPLATPPMSSADTRQLLAAEQDALALERSSLVADREVDDGVEMGL